MKRWNWEGFYEGFIWGILLCGTVLMVYTSCAAPRSRQATLDHNTLSVDAQVQAALNHFETRIGSIEASLVGPVTLGPIGGTHAGRDTVDSMTAQILARTLQWSVMISIVTVGLYVLAHRFRWSRCVLDAAKGKPAVVGGPLSEKGHGPCCNG